MEYGMRPLRSTRRLSNSLGTRPRWYSITNAAAGLPTQVSIYDEIGFYGVAAGEFMADLKAVNGDIELHINSPGGDVHDGIAIYNQLKQRKGSISVVVDGLAASAASFIAQAASPGKLQIAPHAQMMVHNGFSMAIGDANDLRKTADLLDQITTEIASIYAERSGKPVDFWLAKMAAETWYTDKLAVADGLADSILGQEAPAASWDLTVYDHGTVVVNADGNHAPMSGSHNHTHAAYGSQGGDQLHSHQHTHDDDASHGHSHAEPASDSTVTHVRNADGPADLGDGWVMDPDGTVRFDPDGDGDDDSTPEGDTDHDYFDADGKQIKDVPPRPDSAENAATDDDDAKKPFPGAAAPFKKKKKTDDRVLFPLLNADVDDTPWDASKAWAAGAASDDPAKFYAGICAGRKAGDPSTQAAWALPYKYSPSSAPNAAAVKNALSRLPQTEGLTNADAAKATLQKAMKAIDPDYEPSGKRINPALVASVFTLPHAEVDNSAWDPAGVWAMAAASPDPESYYRGICAGRLPGDPSTPQAWALAYRYSPDSPPNASAVRTALAELPYITRLANTGEARSVLDKAMKAIQPDPVPDDEIDPDLLAAAFAIGLKGAVS